MIITTNTDMHARRIYFKFDIDYWQSQGIAYYNL